MFRLLYGSSPARQDLVVIHLTAVVAAGVLALLALGSDTPPSSVALVVLVAITLDEAGGVVANATRSTSDWYRRQPQWLSVLFLAVHVVQPLLMVLALGLSWPACGFLYLFQLICGVLLIRLRAHSLQKPLAAALLALGVVIYAGFSMAPPVLLVLGALYLVKLVFMFPVDHYAGAGS